MMNVKELIPWHWGKREVPVRREDADPVGALAGLALAAAEAARAEPDLAAVARQHRVEALLEIGEGKAVGDDGPDIEAALEHHGHLVPGFVHLAAVDSFDGELVEDDQVPIDCGAAGHDA